MKELPNEVVGAIWTVDIGLDSSVLLTRVAGVSELIPGPAMFQCI